MSGQHHKDERPRKRRRRRVLGFLDLPEGVWWLIRDFAPDGLVWLGLCGRELRAWVRQPCCWRGYVPPSLLALDQPDHCRLVLALRGAGVRRLGHVAVVARASGRGELGSLSRAADLLRGLCVDKLSMSSMLEKKGRITAVLSSAASVQELELEQISRLGRRQLAALVAPAALRKLTLSYCDGQGGADLAFLGAFVALEHLHLRNCDVAWALRHLRHFVSLRKLELTRSSLRYNEGIQDVRELRQLEELTMELLPAGTDLTPLSSLRQLTRLSLASSAAVTDAFLARLPSAFPALRALDLWNCTNIQGPGVPALLQLRRLQSLKLRVSPIDGALLYVLAGLPLVALQLGPCLGLTNADLSLLAPCLALHKLELLDCAGVTSVQELPRLASLRELKLAGCENLASLEPLQQCAKLEVLCLSAFRYVQELPSLPGLRELPCIPSLRELELEECVYVSSLAPLQHCAGLAVLRLTRFLGLTSVHELPRSPALRELVLKDCEQLTSLAPLQRCAKLAVLHLSNWKRPLCLNELPPLPLLQEVYFHRCSPLVNMHALLHYPALRQVTFHDCGVLSAQELALLLDQPQRSLRTLHFLDCFTPDTLQDIAVKVHSKLEVLYHGQIIYQPSLL